MQCAGCRSPIPADAAFCPQCGARVERACPACGAPTAAGDNFCRRCGARLAPATPAAETVLASRGAREGERKQVTVLFADIKGSMELLAGRDPEEARGMLDPALQTMIDAVHRYEGTVNQVMGDGIMALFGAPIAHEDHALRACYAALRIQDALRASAAQVRLGINSGEVVVRAIGSDVDVDYTAVGETTHLAARLEQRADPGTILIALPTLRLVDGFVDVRPLGPQHVKGRAEPIDVFELKAARPARTRLDAAGPHGLSPFVGRVEELAEVRRARARAADGRGQVVAVVGEAGVGKSRFVRELVRECESVGWHVLRAACVSYGQRVPYLPVVDLLRGCFTLHEHDTADDACRKVADGLRALDPALAADAPAVLAMLDLADADPAWTALDPPRRRERTLAAVKRILLAASRDRPVVVVVEDLHWVDAETRSVLDGLVDALPAARLLLVVNYRAEYRHEWSGKTYYYHLRLDPLEEGSGAALLDALLGTAPALAALKRELLARTAGNPFFLEETVRALVETGALVGPAGDRTPARAPGDVEVPPTVQAVLAARIDRLAPEDKRVLQCAAVVGMEVPLAVLEAVADVPAPRLRESLGRLQAAELLYEVQLFPDLAYTFTHALTHEVAYAGLLAAQRRELHARIARAIETLPAGRLTEPTERLSYHAFRGEVWATAFTAARQAARRFASLCSDREAEQVYDRALDALSRLPGSGERDADDIDLRLEMRAVLWRRGRVDRLTSLFADAEALAARLGDARRLSAVYAFLLQYHWAMGEHARAAEFGARCLDAAGAHGDRDLAILGHLYLGHVYYSTADIPRTLDVLERVVSMLAADPTYEQPGVSGLPYAMASAWATLALTDAGEFARARAMAERGEAAARKAEHTYSLTAVQVARGHTIEVEGDAAGAIAVLEPLVATCREKHFVGWIMMADWSLSAAYLEVGRPADALAAAREGRGLKDATGARVWRGREHALLAEALLANGRIDEARAAAAEAVASARAQAEPFSEALAYVASGAIAAAATPREPAAAARLLERAIALLDARGLRPYAARARRRLAAIARDR